MNNKHHRIWLIATAALLITGGVGCKRTTDDVPTMVEGSLRVAIAPTLDQPKAAAPMGAVSRLTPSSTTSAGVFEPNDQVGLFLQDEHSSAFSAANVCYTANNSLVFVPATPVFYKTYYQHGLYGYFPYQAAATTANKIAVALKKDQTDPKNMILCDFLSSSTPNIKPQQIDPNAPEIPMTFYHQMTSAVVRVKNADGSPLSPDFTAEPVQVWFVQRSTGVELDLTNFTKDPTTGYEACAMANRTKDPAHRLANRVFLGHNAAQDMGTTLFYEGILIPETVVASDTLIKIQIGQDGSNAARVFFYIPKAGDPIVASGLAQGKEHLFDLTIQGTQLLVQGGEISDWGTGSTVSQSINGGGITSSRLVFELNNEASAPNTDQITKCTLHLDHKPYTGEVTYTAAGAGKARLTCSINTGVAFPYWFTQALFYDAAGNLVWQTNAVADHTVRIKGNPLDAGYDKVLALIDVATKNVTPGL